MKLTGFDMIEKIGVGGMGSTVWKARQLSLDRIVAIKILSTSSADKTDIDMFRSEAQSAAKLKHPGIVQVYDANTENGIYYFVMEFIAGYTVESWLKRKGVLSESDALLVAEAVACALEYAWDKAGIIHCDIKPGNIMVDDDGTVKVVDLGLARTINAISGQGDSDDVMGTPSYIAPEQALGASDLDFRADIYALGAMLYHLVTGRLLFGGIPEEEVMELQVKGNVPDIIDVGGKVSDGIPWVIEKMLAKKKENRYSSWRAVFNDLQRVKGGLGLKGKMLAEGESTMKRSSNRRSPKVGRIIRAGGASSRVTAEQKSASSVWAKILIAAIAIGLVATIIGVLWWRDRSSIPVKDTVSTVVSDRSVVSKEQDKSVAVTRDLRAEKVLDAFNVVTEWIVNNPGRYEESLSRLRTVSDLAEGTIYSEKVESEIRRLIQDRQKEISEIMMALENKVRVLSDNNKFIEAAQVYEAYVGKFTDETMAMRMSEAQALRERQSEIEEAARKKELMIETKTRSVLDGVITELVAVGVEGAISFLNRTMMDPILESKSGDLRLVKELLDRAAKIDERILDSFRRQMGQEITVFLTDDKKNVVIKKITNNKVYGTEMKRFGMAGLGSTSIPVVFSVSDLAPRERLQRMGSDELTEVALMKGVMALNSKAYEYAKKYFKMTGTVLAERLIAHAGGEEQQILDSEAERALVIILASAGVSVGAYDVEAWLDAIAEKEFTAGEVKKVSLQTSIYREKYGKTEFIAKADDVLSALEELSVIERDREETADKQSDVVLSAEIARILNDPDAVMDMLMEKNFRLDARNVFMDKGRDGKVRGITIRSYDLADISAVAALTTLKSFVYVCDEGRQGMLKDISPLRGLSLEEVTLRNCRVYDIMPLKGMPLKKVDLAYSGVKLLMPLKDMKLEYLDLEGTKVFSFTPLAGMPIRHMVLNDTQVKDISFIKGMPLRYLSVKNIRAYDFTCLQGLQLKYLDLQGTQIKSADVLQGMPLRILNCKGTRIKDFSPLNGTSIEELWLDNPATFSRFLKSLPRLRLVNGISI